MHSTCSRPHVLDHLEKYYKIIHVILLNLEWIITNKNRILQRKERGFQCANLQSDPDKKPGFLTQACYLLIFIFTTFIQYTCKNWPWYIIYRYGLAEIYMYMIYLSTNLSNYLSNLYISQSNLYISIDISKSSINLYSIYSVRFSNLNIY